MTRSKAKAGAPERAAEASLTCVADPLPEPMAHLGGRLATGLVDLTDDLAPSTRGGWWAVLVTFEGAVTCARFEHVRAAPLPASTGSLARARRPTPGRPRWTSGRTSRRSSSVRDAIAEGSVYQANLCRVLTREARPEKRRRWRWPGLSRPATRRRTRGSSGCPGSRSSAPRRRLFLRRDGDLLVSRPIKGTGRTDGDLTAKDDAENVMIVDLVRNDLGRVSRTGSVEVPGLLAVEEHPGLVHLVSTVSGRLREGVGWREILAATFPPGSVTGAPKSSRADAASASSSRCRGAVLRRTGLGRRGRRDSGSCRGDPHLLARAEGMLRFGTGAGITWGSDPEAEWRETELKAARLLAWLPANGDVTRRDDVKAWIDGRLVDDEQAYVSVFDHGFTVGDGVFETMRTEGGRPFALTRHLRRLTRSAAGLGLEPPTEDDLRGAVEATLLANLGAEVGRIRVTVTGGVGAARLGPRATPRRPSRSSSARAEPGRRPRRS